MLEGLQFALCHIIAHTEFMSLNDIMGCWRQHCMLSQPSYSLDVFLLRLHPRRGEKNLDFSPSCPIPLEKGFKIPPSFKCPQAPIGQANIPLAVTLRELETRLTFPLNSPSKSIGIKGFSDYVRYPSPLSRLTWFHLNVWGECTCSVKKMFRIMVHFS